jgi:hypothetical protein
MAKTEPSGPELEKPELEAIAWAFLNSEFADQAYAGLPLERRVDAYLHRYGPRVLLNSGSGYDALVESIMANLGRALRSGTLSPSRIG